MGLNELASRFGLTAKQIAENFDWKRHEIEQDAVVRDAFFSHTFSLLLLRLSLTLTRLSLLHKTRFKALSTFLLGSLANALRFDQFETSMV